jgi:tRNA-dihydrouridine synthase
VINFWHKLQKPITALAPMDDVTDFVFREIIANIPRPDVFFTEFTSTDALASIARPKIIKKLEFSPKQRPIVAQIWGANPENYKKAGTLLSELGVDGIDINMGCPDKTVMKNKSGAALINTPQLASQIIDAVRETAPDIPISVKTRLSTTPASTKEWLSYLLNKNLQALTLHARKAEDMSKGYADWVEIGKVVELKNEISPNTIILGNGDVKTYVEVVEKYNMYHIDGVMIGRGVFTNPWIFEKTTQVKTHTLNEKLDLLLKHSQLFSEKWAGVKNFENMKKFFKIYVKDFIGADNLRTQLMTVKNYQQVESIINEFKCDHYGCL